MMAGLLKAYNHVSMAALSLLSVERPTRQPLVATAKRQHGARQPPWVTWTYLDLVLEGICSTTVEDASPAG